MHAQLNDITLRLSQHLANLNQEITAWERGHYTQDDANEIYLDGWYDAAEVMGDDLSDFLASALTALGEMRSLLDEAERLRYSSVPVDVAPGQLSLFEEV